MNFLRFFIFELGCVTLAFLACALIICIEKINRGDFDEKEERKKK